MGPVALLDEAAKQIRSADAFGLCRDDLEEAIRGLTRVRSAVDACEARFAAEIDRLDDFGDRSAAVLRRLSGCSGAAAKRAAGRAETLVQMPNVEAALSEGRITAEHADVLTNAAGMAGADAVNDAARLLEVATSTNVERTRRAASDWMRELRKGLTPDEEYRRQRALRRLSITQTAEGLIKATALMDPATGAAFKAIIDDMAQRFSEADQADRRSDAPEPRTYTQCRADALAALVGTDNRRAASRWHAEVDQRDAASIAERNGWSLPAPLPPLAPEHLAGLPASAGPIDSVETEPLPIENGLVPSGTPSHLSCDASLRRRNQLLIVADTRAVLGDEWADCEIPGTGPVPFPPTCLSAWPAAPTSSVSSSTDTGSHSGMGARCERSLMLSGVLWSHATEVACSANWRPTGAKRTTSSRGRLPQGAGPTSTISHCCVPAVTTSCMTAVAI